MLYFSNLLFYTVINNPKYISVTHLLLRDNCLKFFVLKEKFTDKLVKWQIHSQQCESGIHKFFEDYA